jgi:hypothetical protein
LVGKHRQIIRARRQNTIICHCIKERYIKSSTQRLPKGGGPRAEKKIS